MRGLLMQVIINFNASFHESHKQSNFVIKAQREWPESRGELAGWMWEVPFQFHSHSSAQTFSDETTAIFDVIRLVKIITR